MWEKGKAKTLFSLFFWDSYKLCFLEELKQWPGKEAKIVLAKLLTSKTMSYNDYGCCEGCTIVHRLYMLLPSKYNKHLEDCGIIIDWLLEWNITCMLEIRISVHF